MTKMVCSSYSFNIGCNTYDNYEAIKFAVLDAGCYCEHADGMVTMLDLLTDVAGLQLLNESTAVGILEELGYEAVEDEEEED